MCGAMRRKLTMVLGPLGFRGLRQFSRYVQAACLGARIGRRGEIASESFPLALADAPLPTWTLHRMPTVTYIGFSGESHSVDVPVGESVMQGAFDNNVPGIDADCGGECACATCHVYIDPQWQQQVGPIPSGSDEEAMLSFAAVTQDNSRLSCQIVMTEALDGLVVTMPDGQH